MVSVARGMQGVARPNKKLYPCSHPPPLFPPCEIDQCTGRWRASGTWASPSSACARSTTWCVAFLVVGRLPTSLVALLPLPLVFHHPIVLRTFLPINRSTTLRTNQDISIYMHTYTHTHKGTGAGGGAAPAGGRVRARVVVQARPACLRRVRVVYIRGYMEWGDGVCVRVREGVSARVVVVQARAPRLRRVSVVGVCVFVLMWVKRGEGCVSVWMAGRLERRHTTCCLTHTRSLLSSSDLPPFQ